MSKQRKRSRFVIGTVALLAVFGLVGCSGDSSEATTSVAVGGSRLEVQAEEVQAEPEPETAEEPEESADVQEPEEAVPEETDELEEAPAVESTAPIQQLAPASEAAAPAQQSEPESEPEPASEPAAAVQEPAAQPEPEPEPVPTVAPVPQTHTVIGNRNSKIYHETWCPSVAKMKESNKVTFETAEAAESAGYVPCKNCH